MANPPVRKDDGDYGQDVEEDDGEDPIHNLAQLTKSVWEALDVLWIGRIYFDVENQPLETKA